MSKSKAGKGASPQLVAQRSACRHPLDMANRLVAAKEEIISLLRGGQNRPD